MAVSEDTDRQRSEQPEAVSVAARLQAARAPLAASLTVLIVGSLVWQLPLPSINRGRLKDPIRTVRGAGYAFNEQFGAA